MNFEKLYSCKAKLEKNQGNSETFVGEELFHINNEVIFSKQYYGYMTFTLTPFYTLKIEFLEANKNSLLRFP